MVDWVRKEVKGNQARFLTLWGAKRELRKAGFVPVSGYYKRDWPSGIRSLTDIRRGIGDGRFVVTVTYYDQDGN
jgi:hypothetical protein